MPVQPTLGLTRTQIPLTGQAYKFEASQLSDQTCINWYPSAGHSKNNVQYDAVEFPTPGLETSIDVSDQPSQTVRWGASIAGVSYAIVGNAFYSLDHTFQTYTQLGTLNSTSGLVKHAYNNTQILLVDGSYGYVYTPSTDTFEEITDPTFVAPHTITFMQGYAVYTQPNTNVFQVGTLNDFLTWDVLFQGTFQYTGDNLVTAISSHLDLWLFGETRTEVRQNQPDPALPDAQPFAPIPGVLIEKGCAAKYSVCQLSNTLFWLAQNEQGGYEVVTVTGEYVPQTVSNEPLHQEWNTYDTVSDAQAFSYFFNGHPFYVITFPTANKTWVYDVSQGAWHQWASVDDSNNYTRHLSNCFWFHQNIPYVGGYNTTKIYRIAADVYTDDGSPIIRERTLPTIMNSLKRSSISQLWVDCEVGRGAVSGQGQNPRLMLTISGDGGRTWTPEKLGNLGRMGEYKAHCRWYRLGTKRYFTAKLRISDPVYCALFGAYIEVLGEKS